MNNKHAHEKNIITSSKEKILTGRTLFYMNTNFNNDPNLNNDVNNTPNQSNEPIKNENEASQQTALQLKTESL